MRQRLVTLIVILLGISFTTFGQNYDRREFAKQFEQGNLMILEQFYDTALNTFLSLQKLDPDNANINYKVGYLYLQKPAGKGSALPYLRTALKGVSKNYTEFDPSEKNTPEIVYLYLAEAYHINYKFDSAIIYFDKFRDLLGRRNKEMIRDIEHRVEWCKNGINIIATPVPFIITNLGDSINTPYPDYSPVISADESIMMFTSRRPGGVGGDDNKTLDDKFVEDIWYTNHLKPSNLWSAAKNIGPIINTFDHEATVGLSADGQQLYVYKDENGNADIYVSELNGDTWSSPERLGSDEGDITDINGKSVETHACVSTDGRTLFFVSDRKGGFGAKDIYRCVKLPNGKWSKALNLGPTINTEYDEDGAFFHPDGKTLFFSSKGHKSMGGYDIFFSVRNDSAWSEPTNVGYPVNTTEDDVFYVASTDGKRAYFSSVRPGGKGESDIYMAAMPQPVVEPVSLTILYIKNRNYEGLPPGTVVKVVSNETAEVLEFRPNSLTGKTVISLPPNKEYTLTIEHDIYLFYKEILVTPNDDFTETQKETPPRTIYIGEALTDGGIATTPGAITGPSKADSILLALQTQKDIIAAANAAAESARLPVYQYYFGYNKAEINFRAPEFLALIDKLLKASDDDRLRIVVEASASTVPTTLFGTNENLASQRAKNAKDVIANALDNKTGKKARYKITVKTAVNGPDYQKDYIENRKTYEKFQYVKVFITK